MTRKDYNLLVLAIANARLDKRNYTRLIQSLVPALETDNPHFNRARFENTCDDVRLSLAHLTKKE